MYAYITCRPDIGYAITTLSKFSSAPSAFYYKQLRHVAKYVRSTIDWGIEFVRPTLLNDLPPTIEHNDLPKLEEEYPVDINIAKLLVLLMLLMLLIYEREGLSLGLFSPTVGVRSCIEAKPKVLLLDPVVNLSL